MAKVSLRAYNREIEAMIDRGHLEEAIAHCQHILKTFPKHLETYRLLGKSYLEAKRHNEAIDIFSRVLVAEPSDFVAQVGMSIIRDEQGKLDDAIWHMERAFETQPSNAAIQGELQRLYGRRDGVQPPRIRMTRGALAHMYMQGELFPQVIAETRGVLEEDAGRTDMQSLLAKAYFKSGQKNDAADAASNVLKRYPYCLDANRVLTEILGSDRPESADVYRRRVFELDPYSAQASGSVFQSNEVGDAAVTLEQLDWNGQPVGMSSDWGSTSGISLKDGEQPDWLKNAAFSDDSSAAPSSSAQGSGQDAFSSSGADAPAQPAEDIPDFLRAAGWGESTGAFDESASSAMFDDAPVADAQPIEQGDMPDWVKAMAPQETTEPAEEAEEIPDWINKIGTGALPVPSVNDDDQSDLLGDLGGEMPASDTESTGDQPDWLKDMGSDDEQSDLLGLLGAETEDAASSQPADDLDFLNTLNDEEPEQSKPTDILSEERSVMPDDKGNLGMGEQEQDDSFAWLENLAAKQGASEGLLTNPDERREEEPDWVKQAKGGSEVPSEQPAEEQLPESAPEAVVETPPVDEAQLEPEPVAAASAPANVDELGKSDEERDDSFSWLENLAAKQGATEGLLTNPDERREDEPDWVKQAKDSAEAQPPAVPTAAEVPVEPAPEPVVESPPVDETPAEPVAAASAPANVEELGKSDEERDDSFSWLENLAAKQGATEGLLTNPDERREDEPDWVKQAKSSAESEPAAAPQPPVESAPAAEDDEMDWMQNAKEIGEKFFDDSMGISEDDEFEQAPESVEAPVEETPVPAASTEAGDEDVDAWLKTLDEPEPEPTPEPVSSSGDDDMLAWMEEEAPATEAAVPEKEAAEAGDDLPGWLNSLDEEDEASVASGESGDLPSWMTDDTGELVAEPTKIEPTRPTDWTPAEQKADEKVEEAAAPEPVADVRPSEPEPEPAPEPEPPAPAPVAEKKPLPKKKEVKPAAPPEPYKEPVTRRTTGMLDMPVDPTLGSARAELSRSNIPGALETYGQLIKKGRFLEEVIYDLRDALYRYPVEVSIWQSLGDAYMRANQLQDALDAYTKAEELLR